MYSLAENSWWELLDKLPNAQLPSAAGIAAFRCNVDPSHGRSGWISNNADGVDWGCSKGCTRAQIAKQSPALAKLLQELTITQPTPSASELAVEPEDPLQSHDGADSRLEEATSSENEPPPSPRPSTIGHYDQFDPPPPPPHSDNSAARNLHDFDLGVDDFGWQDAGAHTNGSTQPPPSQEPNKLRDEIRQYVRSNPQHAYERVLSQEIGPKRGGKRGELYCRCPFHDDHDPSWRMNPSPDKLTWFCEPCNFGGDIFTLAQRLNGGTFPDTVRWLTELFSLNGYQNGHGPKATNNDRTASNHQNGTSRNSAAAKSTSTGAKPRKQVGETQRFEIRDLNGELRATHLRIDYDDSSKSMPWEPAIPGEKVTPSELPLYGTDGLADAPDGDVVILCEGEQKTETLWNRNYRAVGTVTGADRNGVKLHCDESLKVLTRFEVYVWPDNDEPGRAHMEAHAKRLLELGALKVYCINWKEAPDHGDAADYHGEIGPLLLAATRVEPPEKFREAPALLTYADSRALADEAASRPHIVRDLLTVGDFSGWIAKKGIGKSTLLRTLAIAVAHGEDFLGLPTNQTKVWYIDLEPGSQQKRHEAFELLGWHEGDDSLILTQTSPAAGKPWVFEWLEEKILKYNFGLVIIDTVLKLCAVADANGYSQGLVGLNPLEEIIKRTGIHIGGAFHSPKNGNPNNPNASAADLLLGTVSLAGGLGVCLAMRRARGGPGGGAKRVSLFMDPPRYTEQVIVGEWFTEKELTTGRVILQGNVRKEWWKEAITQVLEIAKGIKDPHGKNRPFTATDIMDRTDQFNRKELKRLLSRLTDNGYLLEVDEHMKRGMAMRYQIAPETRNRTDPGEALWEH